MKLVEKVGKRIKLLRQQKGVSQEYLGERLGVTRSFISRMENGKRPISLDKIERIADVLDVEVDDLLIDKNEIIKYYDDLIILKEKFTTEELEAMAKFAQTVINKDKE
jgi:transcriptional regulator with XRE-family HTH domain